MVAHVCNPSYLGGWDWEDCSSRPAQANTSQDHISKKNQSKEIGGVAQAAERLLCKFKSPQFKLQSYQKEKN
jgi:hypothetical protein